MSRPKNLDKRIKATLVIFVAEFASVTVLGYAFAGMMPGAFLVFALGITFVFVGIIYIIWDELDENELPPRV